MYAKLIIITAAFFLGSTVEAYAYIDPATGSLLLQGLLASLAGVAFFVKGNWRKLRGFFSKKKEEPNDGPENGTVAKNDS